MKKVIFLIPILFLASCACDQQMNKDQMSKDQMNKQDNNMQQKQMPMPSGNGCDGKCCPRCSVIKPSCKDCN